MNKTNECFDIPLSKREEYQKKGYTHTGVSFVKNNERFITVEKDSVFEQAKWLTFGKEKEAVIARKDFELENITKTELFVTALGFSEIYVNGKKISDRLYAPAWTNYNYSDLTTINMPVSDTLTYRTFYEKTDITDFLVKGKNTIVFHIGGGWYCQHESRNEGMNTYGDITLCFALKQNGETVVSSDETVKYRRSFVVRSNIYFGEIQDLRLGGYDFSDLSEDISEWKSADIKDAPLTLLREQDCIPDRVTRHIKPECIFKKGDYAIYDLKEEVAGFPVFVFGEGSRIDDECTVRFADELNGDGSLSFHYCGGTSRMQREKYIYDGKAGELHQHFTWHAARYIEVTGNAQPVDFCVAHTDLKKTVEFKSSNETLQWIFDAYIRTQLNNVHCCVPSDCPHRERLGYTGDGQLTARTVMTCFDSEKLYRKWMQDIADSQDIYKGHVEHTAPFYGGGGGPGGWGGAIVFVPYNFYKFYGDINVLKKYYPNMLLYLEYLKNHCENNLVTSSEPGGWCLGDWCSPGNKNLIPEEFVNSYFYIRAMKEVVEISRILGEDCKETEANLEKTTSSFLQKYYNEKDGTFCNSLESADAYGYNLGFGNEKTLKAIVTKYEQLGEFDTGIFGTDILIKVLCENGYKDLAKKLLISEKENTFYNMKKHGATTLWENWDGCDSRCHPMFGAVVEYIVKYFNEA